jgi:eukaryotic-like serine/threonine-protein kinase
MMAAAPATTSELLDLVRKSAVVDEKRLDAHLQKLRASGQMPSEPSKLAGVFVRDGILTHFQAEQLMRGKWNGFSLGKYKVLESLGSGGMGRVYLCEHKLMRRRVAVKILPPSKANEEAVLQRFHREARAAAAVDHPNIVHAYDIDQQGDYHFLVMEYVDGASLQEIVKKTGPMDINRAAHYIRQSALGLEHANSMKLIHRDIKPGNILVDRGGGVKLLDMGLARFFDDTDDILTKKYDENVLGTADYLAPEQAVDSHEVDIRADIYSLGATFYFLLAGVAPFGEGTVAQKLLWHQTRQPKPLPSLRKEVPAALWTIIEKMMAKDRNQRYQRPGEVVEALAPWTQTPIAPPTEAEMPHLSLAATGGPVSSAGDPTVVSSHAPGGRAPGSSHRSWPGKSPGPTTPASAPGGAAVAPHMQLDDGAAQVAEAEEEDVAWENLTSDTEDPSARVDTTPGSGRRVLKANEAKSRAKERRKLRRIFIVVTVLGLAILGVGFAFFFFKDHVGPSGRQRLIVSRDFAGKPYHYASILRALENASPGDVVELHDELHEETLVLDRKNTSATTTNVTIQAGSGSKVVWKPKYKTEKRPVLVISGARDLVIKGITFDGTLDDKRQAETLLRVSGECPGLVLENLEFQNFSRTALLVVNCAGEADQPVKLLNLRVTTERAGKAPFFFDANPQVRPNQNDYIEIDGIDAGLLGRKDGVNGPNISWPAGK